MFKIVTKPTKPKKVKRKPSGYNLHIRKCMGKHSSEMKGKPFGAASQFMKGCSDEWQKMSDEEKAKFRESSDSCVQNEKSGKWDCPTE